jgi:hypothetical protein
MRAIFAQEQQALRQAFAEEQTRLRQSYDKEVAEWRGMLFQNMQAMRTAVHDVRDTAQAMMRTQEDTK